MKTDGKTKAEKDLSKIKAAKGSQRVAVPKINGNNPLAAYERLPIGIVEASPKGKYLGVNAEFCRLLGYSKSQLLRRGIKDCTFEDDYVIEQDLYKQLVAGEIPFYRLEKRYVRKDGSTIWVELTRTLVCDAENKPLYTAGVVLDISERKKTEAQMKWQAHLLAELGDAVLATDEQFVLTGWNKAAERIYGWKAEEVLGRKAADVLQTDFLGKTREEIVEQGVRTGGFSGEVTQVRKDGTRIFIEARSIAIRDEKDEIVGYVSVNRDITERRQVEQAVRESQQLLEATYKHAPIGIVEADVDGRHINVNEEFCHILGYDRKELLQKGIKDFTHEDDLVIDVKMYQQLVAGKIPYYRLEKRYLRKQGGDIWVELTRSLVRDSQGKPLYTIGAVLDISDRKHVERVLRDSVERLRLASSAARMFMWEWDIQRQLYTADENFEKVLGFSGGLLPKGTMDSVRALIAPEDQAVLAEAVTNAIESHVDLHTLQIRISNPENGQIAWLEISGKILYDEDGNALRILGVTQNITENKRAQEEIAIVSRMPAENPNPVMRITPDGNILYANGPSMGLLAAWELEGTRTIPNELQSCIDEAFASGSKKEIEIEQGGKTFSCTLAPIREAGYVNVYGTDITVRKQAQQKLLESEERFRAIVSQATAGISESDIESRLIFVNPTFCEMLGYSESELLGKTIWELTHTEDLEENKRLFRQLLTDGKSYQFEKRFIRRDGSYLWTSVSVSTIRDVQGNPKGGVGVVLDINERKRAEEALRSSEERMRLAIESNRMVAWEWDPISNRVTTSENFPEIYGRPPLEGNETGFKLIWPEDLPAHREKVDQVTNEGGEYYSQFRITRPVDGRTLWLEEHATALTDTGGQVNRLVGVVTDITERKRSEESLTEYARQQGALYKLADHLHRTSSLEDVFNVSLDAILSALQCDRASILLYDSSNMMRFVAWRGLSEEYRKATDGHSPWTPDAKDPTPISMGDVRTADLNELLRTVIQSEGIGSLAFIPLVSNGKLIGKFMVYFNAPHAFSERELDLSRTIAHQLAFGIERRRSDEALRIENERFMQLFTSNIVGILIGNVSGEVVLANDYYLNLLGVSRQDLMEKKVDWKRFTPPEWLPADEKAIQELRERGVCEPYEKEYLRTDGTRVPIYVADALLPGSGEEIAAFVIDISERKRAEERLRQSEERFRQAANASEALVYEVDLLSGTSAIVHGLERLVGYDLQESTTSSNWWHSLIHPEDLPAHLTQLDELLKKGGADECEYRVRHKNGEWIVVQDNRLVVQNEAGQFQRLVGAVIDITERKRAEEALRRNEELFSTLIQTAPFGVYFIDSEFCLRAVNKGSEAVFRGIDPLIGRDFAEILRIVWQEPFATEAIERFRHTLRTGESFISPPVIEPRANIEEIQSYDWQIHRIIMPDGTYGVVCYFYDLSEQKRMEAAVRSSETLYRTIARSIPGGGVYVVDKDFRYLVAEGPVTDAFGLSRDMLEGHTVAEVFTPDQAARMEERLKQNFAGETVSFETIHDGHVYWTQQAPLLDSIGQAIILTIDITERKKVEEALRQSEERFAQFMQHLPGLAWIKDLEGRYIYANAAAEQAFNTPIEKLYGRTDEDIFPPEVAERFRKNDELALQDEKGVQVIETLKQNDGILHYSLVSKFPIPGSDGSTALIGGTAFDITERREAEEALRESEERFRAILRQATAGIVRKDEEGRLIFVNQAFCNMLGYTEAELLGKTMWDLMHPDDIAENKRSYVRLMMEGIPFKLERRLLREDGSIIWVDASVSPIMDAKGKPQSAVAVEVDISGRKRAEEALQQLNLQLEERVLSRTAKLRSVNQTLREEITERKRVEEALRQSEAAARSNEQKLSTLFELLPVGISFLDPEGEIIQMNSALLDILKLSKEELLNKSYRQRKYIRANGTLMSHAEFASARALAEGKTVHNVETGILLENGEVIWTNVSAAPVDVADVSAVVVTVDITDSKRAEQALQESHKRLRMLSQRLVEVQEDERRALARELHDRVGQTLAALNINLIIINGQLSQDAAAQISTRLNDSMKLVAETIALVRDVMTDLRPAVLDDYGLEAALESHIAQFMARYDIYVKLIKPGQPIPRLGPSIEMTCLRIAQEALMNIARHAQATQVSVSLRQEKDAVYMTIQDNGIGIESWQEANRPGSHGLTIMRERAEAFDGDLRVRSVAGQGTKVELRIPLQGQNQAREEK